MRLKMKFHLPIEMDEPSSEEEEEQKVEETEKPDKSSDDPSVDKKEEVKDKKEENSFGEYKEEVDTKFEEVGEKLDKVLSKLDNVNDNEDDEEDDEYFDDTDLEEDEEKEKKEVKTEAKPDEKKETKKEVDLEVELAKETRYRENQDKFQGKTLERLSHLEQAERSRNLDSKLSELTQKYPKADRKQVLRAIAAESDDSKRSVEDIVSEIHKFEVDREEKLRKDIGQEIEDKMKKEQKNNVSIPQNSSPGNSKTSQPKKDEFPARDQQDLAWETAADKAKAEVEE